MQNEENHKKMKKRINITLRTKIYLTIVALLSLTGVFYAANPTVFVMPGHGVSPPISPAVTQTQFFVSQYENGQIDTVDCLGIGSFFSTIVSTGLGEKYMAIAPAESVAAGFNPGDLFVTRNQQVLKTTPPLNVFMPVADWSGVDGGCPLSDHSSLTFDKVGTFGNKMIIACENGRLFTVDGTGGNGPPHVTHLADTSTLAHGITFIEGPAVLPKSFGPLGGQIMVADDQHHQLYTIDNLGNVNYNPFGFPDGTFLGAEQVLVIPEFPCTYCGDRAFFTASALNDHIVSYPRSDFDGLGNDILVTTELNPNFGTFRVHFDVPSNSYQFSVFDGTATGNEGSSFVDGSCPPTPSPTPTTCTALFVIGDLDAVVGNHVTFWSKQWSKDNHLSGVDRSPPSFKGFVTCTNNPPTCGDTWQGEPGNSGHPPDTIPADITVIVSSSITKSGSTESGNIVKLVTVHV